MEPIFTDEQLNTMSRENLIELMKIMRDQQRKTETKMQLMEEKQKELEFLNALLSDCKFRFVGSRILIKCYSFFVVIIFRLRKEAFLCRTTTLLLVLFRCV